MSRFRGFAADEAEAARRALVAGTDMEMVLNDLSRLAGRPLRTVAHRVGDR
jgi:hypothetical protein